MADHPLRLPTGNPAPGEKRDQAPAAEPTSVTIELDDRAFLFPQHKPVTHLRAQAAGEGLIELAVVYEFNRAKENGHICTLGLEDARQLCRKMVDAYYQGRTQNVLSNTAKIGVVFNPNGFLVMFQQPGPECDLFISPSSLLRVTRGVLKLIDKVQPVVAH